MFQNALNYYYNSLAKRIADQKRKLGLKREEILEDPTRVTDITHGQRPAHHPYLLSDTEVSIFFDLIRADNKEKFEQYKYENMAEKPQNYDLLLWDHIDWDTLFLKTLEDLNNEEPGETIPKECRDLFGNSLLDYVPFAKIQEDNFKKIGAKIYYTEEEKYTIKKEAIEWVYKRYGSDRYKTLFLEQFSGKKLAKFDSRFATFVKNYLEEYQPKEHSLGLEAYRVRDLKNTYSIYYNSLPEVKYPDYHSETDESEVLESFLKEVHGYIDSLEQYQKKFDDIFQGKSLETVFENRIGENGD